MRSKWKHVTEWKQFKTLNKLKLTKAVYRVFYACHYDEVLLVWYHHLAVFDPFLLAALTLALRHYAHIMPAQETECQRPSLFGQ